MQHSNKKKKKRSLGRELGSAFLGALLCGCALIGHSCYAQQFGPVPLREAAPSPAKTPNETPSPLPTSISEASPADTGEASPTTASSPEGAPEAAEEEALHQEEGMLSPSSQSSKDSIFGRASAQAPAADEKMTALLTRIREELPTSNGTWSVYLCDIYKNSEGSLNESTMQAASLIKLFIMGTVYENYESLSGQHGADTIDGCLSAMITVSDNDAANSLTSFLGGGDPQAGMEAVNRFCQSHGYTHTSMGRLLLQSSALGDNYTSVTDCGHFLKGLYNGDYEEFPYADAMFELLCGQTRQNKIPAKLPEGVQVANKTGELADVENDAGIIYDELNDLILVFMSEHLSDAASAQNTIASLSREIYDYYEES